MEVEISEDVSKRVNEASRILGLNKKELINRAVRLYLHNILEEEKLKEDLEAWEMAGIEDLKKFEEQI